MPAAEFVQPSSIALFPGCPLRFAEGSYHFGSIASDVTRYSPGIGSRQIQPPCIRCGKRCRSFLDLTAHPLMDGAFLLLAFLPCAGLRFVFVLARIVGLDNNPIPTLCKGLFAHNLDLVQTLSAYNSAKSNITLSSRLNIF
jgi:hypothetical protein